MAGGLADLFQKNPHPARAATMSNVARESGLAKPLLAGMAGAEMRRGEEFDANQGATQRAIDAIFKVSKYDPQAATQMLEEEVKRNPGMKSLTGIKFSGKTSKDGWMTITGGDGQAWMVYKEGLPAIAADPQNEELKSQYMVKVGSPKPAAPDKSKKRTEVDVSKDIRTAASSIASRLGDESLTDAIIRGAIKDPKVLATMNSAKSDPYIRDMIGSLQVLKDEYRTITGRDWATGSMPSGGQDSVAPAGSGTITREQAQQELLRRRQGRGSSF